MADVAVLIASSRTGRELVKQSLERGLSVSAVVRNQNKFFALVPPAIANHPKLSIHPCDPDDVTAIKSAIAGSKLIFIACGGFEIIKPAYYNQNLVNTVLAGIALLDPADRPKRIVLLSVETNHPVYKEEHPWLYWLFGQKLMTSVTMDLAQAEGILIKNKDLVNYTFVQVGPIVTTPKASERPELGTTKSHGYGNGKVNLVGKQDGAMISYTDLATGMLNAGFDEKFKNGMTGVLSEVPPEPGWEGMKPHFELLGEILVVFLLKPIIKVTFLVTLGYMLKGRMSSSIK